MESEATQTPTAEATEIPTEEVVQEPTETPTAEDTATQTTGGQVIQPHHTSTPGGGEATEVPFEPTGNGTNTGNGTSTGGEVSSPEAATEVPTERPAKKPTKTATVAPTEAQGGPPAGAGVVAEFPQAAGATTGLRFAVDGGAFALDLGGQIVVADANGHLLTTLTGLSPVWSPRGLVLLYADGSGGVAVWDRQAGQSISISEQTRGNDAVVDYPAGWSDITLLYLRTFADDPGRAELHGSEWDGSNDQVLWQGSLDPLLARPVYTQAGVWALTRAGWVRIGLDGTADDPVANPWGAIGDPVASPFGSAIAFAVGGQLVAVSADSPWSALWEPVPAAGGFAFAPDGTQLVAADGAGLALYALDGGASLGRAAEAGASAPGWSETGIYFVAAGDPPTLRLLSPDDFASP
ncbi:MAG TPA: hypothetical protein VH482_29685 [Thermomicrobiales bacterium]